MEIAISIIAILSIIIGFNIFTKINKKKYIESKFGKKQNREFTKLEDEKYLKEAFNLISKYNNTEILIDDNTWNDLEMFKIFDLINNTQSSLGSEALYSILRQINISDDFEKHFTELMEDLSKDDKKRLKIQVILNSIGKSEANRALTYIFSDVNMEKNNLIKYILMGTLPIIGIILIAFKINPFGLMLLSSSVFYNFIFTYTQNNVNEGNYSKINYVLKMINASKKILKLDTPSKEILKNEINKIKTLTKISILGKTESGSDVELIANFINTVFMLPLISYEIAKKHIKNNKTAVVEIWKEVGNIESAISILSYKQLIGRENYIKPDFTQNHQINATNVKHPLLQNPVGNDVKADGIFLVSGSNASGKSTYVKSIAINAILSQTIFMALANSFSLKKGNILTSMAIKDDVEEGDSYFIAEIKSLKRLIEDLDNGNLSYYFIDEILKGTNTIERIASSASIIKYLSDNDAIAYIATHDIELTEMFNDEIQNIHFKEIIDENNQIVFDYKLHQGPSNTKNAIKLLDIMKFPRTIVTESNERVMYFLENRKWDVLSDW